MDFDHGTSAAMSRAFASRDEPPCPDTRASNGTRGSEKAHASRTMNNRMGKSRLDISKSKEFKLQELAMLSLSPILRSIHHWWLLRAEQHYLICADVEQQRAREAQMNVAYYQKRAALARSARN